MAKKPKNESIQDIIDRIEEELIELRDKAVECYEQCNKIAHEIGDKLDIAGTYHNLGELSKTEAKYEKLIFFIRKAAEIVERVGHKTVWRSI